MAQSDRESGGGQSSQNSPIVIVKRTGGHGGHHGGAWKVAYADFVTAMMALFIVLWLLNSEEKVKQAVAGYFQDPSGSGKEAGSGKAGTGESMSVSKDDMSGLGEKLQQAMKQMPEFKQMKDQVQITVTGEGLRIELLETDKGLFFESGSPQPSRAGQELLSMLAAELGKLPNDLLIEGHTDAKPFAGATSYGNWELSTDRANAARRLMQTQGLRAAQVIQVRGFADQKLRKAEDPMHASNRRISLIVQYQSPGPEGQPKAPPAPQKGAPSALPAAKKEEHK